MKYLVIMPSQIAPLPPDRGAKLTAASQQWIQAHLDNGSIDCVYGFVDNIGAMAIHNAGSHEEMFERLLDYPLYPFFRWEVKPLCDWKQYAAAIDAAFWSGG